MVFFVRHSLHLTSQHLKTNTKRIGNGLVETINKNGVFKKKRNHEKKHQKKTETEKLQIGEKMELIEINKKIENRVRIKIYQ